MSDGLLGNILGIAGPISSAANEVPDVFEDVGGVAGGVGGFEVGRRTGGVVGRRVGGGVGQSVLSPATRPVAGALSGLGSRLPSFLGGGLLSSIGRGVSRLGTRVGGPVGAVLGSIGGAALGAETGADLGTFAGSFLDELLFAGSDVAPMRTVGRAQPFQTLLGGGTATPSGEPARAGQAVGAGDPAGAIPSVGGGSFGFGVTTGPFPTTTRNGGARVSHAMTVGGRLGERIFDPTPSPAGRGKKPSRHRLQRHGDGSAALFLFDASSGSMDALPPGTRRSDVPRDALVFVLEIFEDGGARWVELKPRKRRRMNPMNVKALRRSLRRVKSSKKITKKIDQALRKSCPR